MRQWKGFSIIFILLLISGLSAGCNILSSSTKSPTSISPTSNEIFSVTINGKPIQLKLIKSFNGDNTKIVDFTVDKSPVTVIWGTTPTSQIQSNFDLSWQSEADNNYGSEWWTFQASFYNNCQILEGIGKYKLRIQSSGCSWWVKVGVEK